MAQPPAQPLTKTARPARRCRCPAPPADPFLVAPAKTSACLATVRSALRGNRRTRRHARAATASPSLGGRPAGLAGRRVQQGFPPISDLDDRSAPPRPQNARLRRIEHRCERAPPSRRRRPTAHCEPEGPLAPRQGRPMAVPNMPPLPGGLGRLGTAAMGVLGLGYGVSQSLFNVEGGHRAIVFNRLSGIKNQARP